MAEVANGGHVTVRIAVHPVINVQRVTCVTNDINPAELLAFEMHI
jgi:hypothetical protein